MEEYIQELVEDLGAKSYKKGINTRFFHAFKKFFQTVVHVYHSLFTQISLHFSFFK